MEPVAEVRFADEADLDNVWANVGFQKVCPIPALIWVLYKMIVYGTHTFLKVKFMINFRDQPILDNYSALYTTQFVPSALQDG